MSSESPIDMDADIVRGYPYTPAGGNNDGTVRDVNGTVVADMNGHEGMAESVAALINEAVENGRCRWGE